MLALVAGGVVLALHVTNQNQPSESAPAEPVDPRPAAPDTTDADSPAAVPDDSAGAEPSAPAEPKPATPTEKRPTKPAAGVEKADKEAKGAADSTEAWFSTPQGGKSEQTVTLGSVGAESGYAVRVRLTNRGGSILGVDLTDHFATVADKQLHAKDPAAYEAARKADPEKYRGRYSILNPTPTGDGTVAALATRAVGIAVEGRTDSAGDPLELTPAAIYDAIAGKYWDLHDVTDDSVSYSFTFFRGHARADAADDPILRIVKTFRVQPNSYSVTVSVRLENLSDNTLQVLVDHAAATWLVREDVRGDSRNVAYGKISGEERAVKANLRNARKLGKSLEKPEEGYRRRRPGKSTSATELVLGASDADDPTLWIGTTNKYFASLVHLRPEKDTESLSAPNLRAEFYAQRAHENSDGAAYVTGIRLGSNWDQTTPGLRKALRLMPHESREATFDVFAGPKDRGVFVNEADPRHDPMYAQLNYLSTISLRACFCASSWLAFKVMWLLKILSGFTFGNYGLAIILLVFVVRILLHPLAKKSQLSMLKMQKLNPEMQKLKEKYADDKDTLNREMMKFYRQQGATPLLGCLPMLLQMPIWIALYTGISASVGLRHAAFLPVWITDLAAPDALFSWSQPVPFLGLTSFNLLPLLLTVAMFFQTKLTPQMSQPSAQTDDRAQQQQKMMRYMMPGMMLLFFYQAPSGLTLYIMSSTAAGVLDSILIRRHIRAKEAIEAAQETTVAMPGKAARSSRPKKPKGPMWFKQG
jgi:YidC/Oxa1 family membrane protein insertase